MVTCPSTICKLTFFLCNAHISKPSQQLMDYIFLLSRLLHSDVHEKKKKIWNKQKQLKGSVLYESLCSFRDITQMHCKKTLNDVGTD